MTKSNPRVQQQLLAIPLLATVFLFVVFSVAEVRSSFNQRVVRELGSSLIPALEASREMESTLVVIQRQLQDAAAGEDALLVEEPERGLHPYLQRTALQGDRAVVGRTWGSDS